MNILKKDAKTLVGKECLCIADIYDIDRYDNFKIGTFCTISKVEEDGSVWINSANNTRIFCMTTKFRCELHVSKTDAENKLRLL